MSDRHGARRLPPEADMKETHLRDCKKKLIVGGLGKVVPSTVGRGHHEQRGTGSCIGCRSELALRTRAASSDRRACALTS
mmetsp:Transcript_76269/g.204582  ORF Transcript_76269/g.204582 Transcript_76269/m.204582 type:complete len:80 (-) Transcript_76269:83-322(-)